MINKMQEVINRCLPLTWDESLTYVEALAKMLAKINEIIASLGTASDGLADIYLQITVIKEGEGGDLPSLTEIQAAVTTINNTLTIIKGEGWTTENLADLAAAIAAMKGTGWTTENLVDLQDQIDTITGQLDGIEDALDLIIGGEPT